MNLHFVSNCQFLKVYYLRRNSENRFILFLEAISCRSVCLSNQPSVSLFRHPVSRSSEREKNFCSGHATYKPPCRSVGRSVRRSVCHTLLFFAFLGILRVGKFVFEHAPAQIITAPAQVITAPAQLITAPAQLPATIVVVYTALWFISFHFPLSK